MEISEVEWPPENLLFSRPIPWMSGDVVCVRTFITGDAEKPVHLICEKLSQLELPGYSKIDHPTLDCILREATKLRSEITRTPVATDYIIPPNEKLTQKI